MKFGLTQIVVPEETKTFFKTAKSAGYDCVEILLKESKGYLNANSSDDEIAEINEFAKSLGLEIVSTCMGSGKYNLLDSGQTQKNGIQEAILSLEVSKKAGAQTMLHTLGSLSEDLYYEDAYNNAVVSLKEIAKSAQKLGCILAIEFIWKGFLFSPLEMRKLIDDVGSEYIGFYFDPGNMKIFQYPQHWVRALGNRTKMVHLKDFTGKALNGRWTALLEGDVNFKAVMRELKNAGVAPVFISEVHSSQASYEDTYMRMKEIASYYK